MKGDLSDGKITLKWIFVKYGFRAGRGEMRRCEEKIPVGRPIWESKY
jgi:hypothetical protein